MLERDVTPRLPGDRWWCVAMVAVLVVPLVVSAVHLLTAVGSDYYPVADWAVIELRTRDVAEHFVGVGPYSRFGWSHPGPLMFYVLYLPYRLFGSESVALHVGALMVNVLTIIGVALVAFRRGRLPVAIAVLVPLGLLTHALGIQVLRDPWNPYLPILPLFLLMLLAWSVVVDDLWMAPLAIVLATFTMQSHAGFAIVSVALVGFAALVVIGRGLLVESVRRRSYWLRVARVTGVSLGVALLLWAPVLYGTFVQADGNIAAMWEFFASDQQTASMGDALEVLGLQWGPRPEWIFGARGSSFRGVGLLESQWWCAVGAAAAGIVTALAYRRRARDVVWFAALMAVAFLGGVVAVSGVVGPLFPYIVRWTWVLGAGLGVLVLLGAWSALSTRIRVRWLPGVTVTAVLVLATLGLFETVDAFGAGTPYAAQQPGERVMVDRVLPAIDPGEGPVLVVNRGASSATPGLVAQLERRGIDVDVRPDQPVIFGTWRSPHGGPYRATVRVVADSSGSDRIPGELIAEWTRERTPKERRDLERHIQELRRLPPGTDRRRLLRDALALRGRPTEHYEVYLEQPG